MRKRRLGGQFANTNMDPQGANVPMPPQSNVYNAAAGDLNTARTNYQNFKVDSGGQFGELGIIMVSYFIALCIYFVDSGEMKSTYTYVLSLTFVSITMSTSLYSGIISSSGKGGTAISKIILATGGVSILTWCYFSYRLYDDMNVLRAASGIEEEEES